MGGNGQTRAGAVVRPAGTVVQSAGLSQKPAGRLAVFLRPSNPLLIRVEHIYETFHVVAVGEAGLLLAHL